MAIDKDLGIKQSGKPQLGTGPQDSTVQDGVEGVRGRLRPDIQGIEVAALNGSVDRVESLGKETKVVSISVRGKSIAPVMPFIEAQGGKVLAVPFGSGDDTAEVLVLFPNKTQADTACAAMQSQSSVARIGMQNQGGAFVGLFRYTQSIAVPGAGVDEARACNDHFSHPESQSANRFPEPSSAQLQIVRDTVRPISESISRQGVVVGIKLLEMEPDKRGRVIGDIYRLVDRETEEIQHFGSEIVVVTTGENAIRKWMPELSGMICAKEDPTNLNATVFRGGIEPSNVGTEEKPLRMLKGEAFQTIQTPHRKGLFVNATNRIRLEEGNRNVKFTKTRDCGRDTLEVLELEVPKETTLGPEKMLGRESEWGRFKAQADRFSQSQNPVLLIQGHPGIGKSRFSREARTHLEEKCDAVTISSKAEEHERTKGFGFLRRMIKDLLDSYSGDVNTKEYKALAWFDGRQEAPKNATIEKQLDAIYASPVIFARVIRQAARRSPKRMAIFLDDMQWCDTESAEVVAALILGARGSGEDNLLIAILARNDQKGVHRQELHPKIQAALNLGYVENIELKELAFTNHELLKQYILGSPGIDLPEDTAIPQPFLIAVQRICGGIPLDLDNILADMLSRGDIRVVNGQVRISSAINYENFTGDSVYGNRIDRLPPRRKEILGILVLFNSDISRKLFKILYPHVQEGDLYGLEAAGMISCGSLIRITHDKFRQKATEKFPKTRGAVWDAYIKVREATSDRAVAPEITDTELFEMLLPELDESSSMELKAATLKHGLPATRKYGEQHRNAERRDALAKLQQLTVLEGDQRFQVAFGIADAKARLGERVCFRDQLAEAERHAGVNFGNLMRLWKLACEAAYHLEKSPHQIGADTQKLMAMHSMMIPAVGSMSSVEKAEYAVIPLYREVLVARKAFLEAAETRGEQKGTLYDSALSKCQSVMDSCRGITRLTAPQERVLVEAKRVYALITAEKETTRRRAIDADAEFLQDTPATQAVAMKKAMDIQREVAAAYRSSPHLAMSPQDIIRVYETLAKLEAYNGQKSQALMTTRIAIAEALAFMDIALLTENRQQCARILTSETGSSADLTKMKDALRQLETGMVELYQLREGENHENYKFLACDAAHVVCHILKHNAANLETEERTRLIQRGWNYIWDALNKFEPIPDDDYKQYFLPTIRFLQQAAREHNVYGLVVPRSAHDRTFTDTDARDATQLLIKTLKAAQNAPEGVKELLRLHLQKLGHQALPAYDGAEMPSELDGLDPEIDVRVVRPPK